MIYLLALTGREHRAAVEEAGPGRYRIVLDGEEHLVSATLAEPGIYSLLVSPPGSETDGGISFEADVLPSNDHLRIAIQGESFDIVAIDERRKRQRTAAGVTETGGEVRSPMPGKVVRVLATAGSAVRRGQGLVVVEAMKMENEIGAPRDGTVKRIAVTEGQAVEGGALLVEIE